MYLTQMLFLWLIGCDKIFCVEPFITKRLYPGFQIDPLALQKGSYHNNTGFLPWSPIHCWLSVVIIRPPTEVFLVFQNTTIKLGLGDYNLSKTTKIKIMQISYNLPEDSHFRRYKLRDSTGVEWKG